MSSAGFCSTVTKIFRVPADDGKEYLIGMAGDAGLAAKSIAWVKEGRSADKFPVSSDKDACLHILVIEPDRKICVYQNTGHPIHIEDRFFVMGAGADFAAAALYLGADSKHAIQVACALSCHCGNGLDCLTLEHDSK